MASSVGVAMAQQGEFSARHSSERPHSPCEYRSRRLLISVDPGDRQIFQLNALATQAPKTIISSFVHGFEFSPSPIICI